MSQDPKIHTAAFTVPLGKCMHNASRNSANADDVKVVADFKAVMAQFEAGTPEFTYYNTMEANALMVKNGIRGKMAHRDEMLKVAEQRYEELKNDKDRKDRLWAKIKVGRELLLFGGVGGFIYSFFAFIISVPIVGHQLHGSHEGYATIATMLGGLLLWSSIRNIIDDKRAARASRQYRREVNRIWKTYRVSIKREYYHALNSVNIAWKQMTGEDPPDAEIAKLLIDALTHEAEDHDEANGGDEEVGIIGELLGSLGLSKGRKKARST